MPKRKYIRVARAIQSIELPIGPSIAYIPLNHGLYALIDRAAAKVVCGRSWFTRKTGSDAFYVIAHEEGKTLRLHRLITGASTPHVDHKNANPLDNRSANLRPCSVSQNHGNARKRSDNQSGYKGVSINRARGKWQAHARGRYLGIFNTPEDAHAAYCRAAQREYGEFARTS